RRSSDLMLTTARRMDTIPGRFIDSIGPIIPLVIFPGCMASMIPGGDPIGLVPAFPSTWAGGPPTGADTRLGVTTPTGECSILGEPTLTMDMEEATGQGIIMGFKTDTMPAEVMAAK